MTVNVFRSASHFRMLESLKGIGATLHIGKNRRGLVPSIGKDSGGSLGNC